MAEPSAYLQHERREEGDLPEVQEDEELLKSKEVKTVSLTRPAGHRGKQRRAGAAGQQAVPRCQPPSTRPSGAWSPATIVHRFLGPGRRGLGLGHPGTQRQGCQEPSGAGEAPLPAQEDEENATFVSCSHLALTARGGGARGGRYGSAPPTGNF